MSLDFLSPEEKQDIDDRLKSGKLKPNSPEFKALLIKKYEDDPLGFAKKLLPDHFKDETPLFHHDLMALASSHNRLALAAPRGHAKSTVIGLAYVLHQILYERKKNIIFISASEDMAKRFLRRIKEELISNKFILAFWGDLSSAKWSETEFETSTGIAVHAKGRGAMIRGLLHGSSRPDLIVLDDIEDEELVRSDLRRMDLAEWFNGAVLPSLEPKTGQVIFIGTILHTDSLLANLLNSQIYPDFTHKKYEAILPDNTALWPERFPIQELQKIKESYIARGALHQFFMEYQNDPTPPEAAMFKAQSFQFYEQLPDKLTTEVYIDLGGGSEKRSGDPTAMVVLGVDQHNTMYVVDYINATMGGDMHKTVSYIFQLVAKYRPRRVVIEKTIATNLLMPTLTAEMKNRNVHFVVDLVTPTRGSGQVGNMSDGKYQRIASMEGAFRLGVIKLKHWMTELQEQLIRFPRSKHDDLTDALAYGYQHMNRKMVTHKQFDQFGFPINKPKQEYIPLYPEIGL